MKKAIPYILLAIVASILIYAVNVHFNKNWQEREENPIYCDVVNTFISIETSPIPTRKIKTDCDWNYKEYLSSFRGEEKYVTHNIKCDICGKKVECGFKVNAETSFCLCDECMEKYYKEMKGSLSTYRLVKIVCTNGINKKWLKEKRKEKNETKN